MTHPLTTKTVYVEGELLLSRHSREGGNPACNGWTPAVAGVTMPEAEQLPCDNN
jgi:hypothetical protein